MFCERAAKARIPRNLKQSGDKVHAVTITHVSAVALTNFTNHGLWYQTIRISKSPLYYVMLGWGTCAS